MEYFLNEGQALLICALSRTPKAAEVRRALIEVFMAWRHGQLAAPAEAPRLAKVPAHTRRVAIHRETPARLEALVARLEAAAGTLVPVLPSEADVMRDGLAVLWLGGRRYLVDFADHQIVDRGRALAVLPMKHGETPEVAVIEALNPMSEPARWPWGSRTATSAGHLSGKYGAAIVLGRIVTEAKQP